jgi:hypothetical protein
LSRAWRGAIGLLAAGALASGCELTETTVADGEPVVVVHAVLEPPRQPVVVLEWSRTGQAPVAPAPACQQSDFIPQCPPGDPIRGATVVLNNLDIASNRCDGTATLSETDPARLPGVYRQSAGCFAPLPGNRITMTVTLPGHAVTGALVVPVVDSLRTTPRSLILNRDRDTLRVAVWTHNGRALQVEARPLDNLNNRAFLFVTDTLGIAIPGNFTLPSDTNSGTSVFRPGHGYMVALGVTDTNYYDFARSSSDPFTGRGFINHLVGGVGVFGAINTYRFPIRVVANIDDPREGEWLVQGTVAGVDVNVRWDGYLDGRGDTVAVGAFVSGNWLDGVLSTSVDGTFRGNDLEAEISFVSGPDSALVRKRQHLTGRFAPNGPFPIEVRDVGGALLGTLLAVRQ